MWPEEVDAGAVNFPLAEHFFIDVIIDSVQDDRVLCTCSRSEVVEIPASIGCRIVDQPDPGVGYRVQDLISRIVATKEIGKVLSYGIFAYPVATIVGTEFADGVISEE